MSDRPRGTSVAIIGDGPAGLAAAKTLLNHGATVTLFDENPAPGGQYYKQYTAAPRLRRDGEIEDLHAEGLRKFDALPSDGLTVRHNALAWGLFAGNQLAVYADDGVELSSPDAVVLATGAIEKAAAFPGWTLPGVMTAGGAQTMLSREAILPGKRFLLAGTGPLLLAIALELAEAGGVVEAVIEGSGLGTPAGHMRGVIGHPSRLRQFIHYRRELRQRNIPVYHRRTVVEVRGEGHVSEAVVARIDADWRVIPDTETTYQVDTVCLHYGFATSAELALQAGCTVEYERERGGWHVTHDNGMRASQPGIYVAGQITGIGGADLGEATGSLAGHTVALDLGLIDNKTYTSNSRRPRAAVRRGRGFARMLNSVYTPGAGITDLMTPDTVVCRCEEVTRSEIDLAIKRGALTMNDVKRQTRCGMGYCQGRICSPTLSLYLQVKAGVTASDAGTFNFRAPVKPVPLGALARMPDPEAVPLD